MRYLTSLILGIGVLGIWIFSLLDARSRDASLRIHSHRLDPERGRLYERYLQFSGTPGILLFGSRSGKTTVQADAYAYGEPWRMEFKPYPFFPEDIGKTRNTKYEGPVVRTTLGFHFRTHGESENDFFARYLFVSCRWMAVYFALLIVVQLGLHWYLARRAAKPRAAAPASAPGPTSAP
jgi:hypothetical protein